MSSPITSAAPAPTGRRAELLAAGVEVLAASGLRGLTHRAVDAAAGLPEGTCSAYLRTRSALLVALAEHVGGHLAHDVEQMAAALPRCVGEDIRDDEGDRGGEGDPGGESTRGTDVDAVVASVTSLLLGWLERPEVVRAQAELALEAARNPELTEVFDRWRAALVEVVEGIAQDAGAAARPHRAAVAVAALEGVLVTAARMPAGARAEFVEEAVPALVTGLHETA